MAHDWPGNVRELKNAVESAAILATGETVGADGFADLARRYDPALTAATWEARRAADGASVTLPVGASLETAERLLIAATLRRHPGKREAARALGIGLRTLYTKLKQYGLRAGGRAESA
jgi:DNA-binding NtrC family response regulator